MVIIGALISAYQRRRRQRWRTCHRSNYRRRCWYARVLAYGGGAPGKAGQSFRT